MYTTAVEEVNVNVFDHVPGCVECAQYATFKLFEQFLHHVQITGPLGVGCIVYIPLRMGWRVDPIMRVLDWVEARLQVSTSHGRMCLKIIANF